MKYEKLLELGKKESERQSQFNNRIFCCTSTACLSTGATEVLDSLERSIEACECSELEAEVVRIGCMGLCSRGPMVRVETSENQEVLYADVDADTAQQIVANHLPIPDDNDYRPNEIAAHDFPHFRARLRDAAKKTDLSDHVLEPDMPFFAQQEKIVLSESGTLNPESIDDYVAHGGYSALDKILREMTPEEVCGEILQSGLRGRGGAGFPTGLKWKFALQEQSEAKYVVVNGDEGDPGAYMDRTVMEYNPHRVLEGLMIAAYAVGANHGYFYIRGEYPIAVHRVREALKSARRRGVTGRKVLGTDFSFYADVRIGAGAFVCGEETALIFSIEGKRGMPRIRPPYPTKSGLWDKPTVINNVETLANVPPIITKGAEWYAGIGSEKSKGTKVFALTGQLKNTGLIEVPMGITLGDIVYNIGGGVPEGREFKAAQTGGPSGGCIPNKYMESPVDFENLTELGSIMGSGGLVVIDDTTNMPDFARFFMDFCVDESCGKCVPCRVGTVQIRNLLDKIISGEGAPKDLDKLEKLCETVKTTSLCGLGQSAPNPVISTLQYFRHEYEALIPELADTSTTTDMSA